MNVLVRYDIYTLYTICCFAVLIKHFGQYFGHCLDEEILQW